MERAPTGPAPAIPERSPTPARRWLGARLRDDADRAEVELVAGRNDGPCAGVHRMTAREFLARGVDRVPERYEVRVRYAGAYATRRRVW